MTNKKLFPWTRKPGTQQACKTAFCGDTNTLFEADEVTGVTAWTFCCWGGDLLDATETALFQVCLQDPCTVLRYNTPNTPARTHARVPCARTTRMRPHHASEWLLQRFLFLSALQDPCTVLRKPRATQKAPAPSPRRCPCRCRVSARAWGVEDVDGGFGGQTSLPWMDGTPPACDHWRLGPSFGRVGRACCGSFGYSGGRTNRCWCTVRSWVPVLWLKPCPFTSA
jgi:hypothetical protein